MFKCSSPSAAGSQPIPSLTAIIPAAGVVGAADSGVIRLAATLIDAGSAAP